MKIIEFPEFKQITAYDCGATALEAVLTYYGKDIKEKNIMDIAHTDTAGTTMDGLIKVVENVGLKYKTGSMTIDDIKDYIRKKVPVILLLQAWTEKPNIEWTKDWNDGHYVVAIGYDDTKVYFEDPWISSRAFLTFDELEERWHGKVKDGEKEIHSALVVFGNNNHYNPDKAVHMN